MPHLNHALCYRGLNSINLKCINLSVASVVNGTSLASVTNIDDLYMHESFRAFQS